MCNKSVSNFAMHFYIENHFNNRPTRQIPRLTPTIFH